MAWFKVVGLGTLDGMLVERHENGSVVRLVQNNIMLGDRTASATFPVGAIAISQDYLKPIDDPELREFASDNPWGKFLEDGKVELEDFCVTWCRMERCLSVNVRDTKGDRTIFSHNYTDENLFGDILSDIENEHDSEDLIFALKGRTA